MSNDFNFNAAPQQTATTPANDEFDWDSEFDFDDPDEYIILPPGEYDYEVRSFQRSRYDGGVAKDGHTIPPCPVAKIQIGIKTDTGDVVINDSFFINKGNTKKLSGFFQSVGLAKAGSKVKMSWWSDDLVGMTGRAKINNRKYNDKTYNNVSHYIAKKE